jgi:hypothetical protein
LEPTETNLIKLEFALDKLSQEQLKKIELYLNKLNKKENPLIYHTEFSEAFLSISIQENPEFKQVKLRVPFTLEKYANEQMISRLRSSLVSREDIDKNVKQEVLEILDKVATTLPILQNKINENLKDTSNLVLCHGDTNNTNILVGPDDKVYLIDLDLIGHNFFFVDLSFFIIILKYKIDFKTLKFTPANDVEKLKKPIYSMYKHNRPNFISFKEFDKKLEFGNMLNSIIFGIISALNALENDNIGALSMLKFTFQKYFLRFKEQCE